MVIRIGGSWALRLTFFVKSFPIIKLESLLKQKLLLQHYGGVSFKDSEDMNRFERKFLLKELKEIIVAEKQQQAKRDNAYIKAMSKVFGRAKVRR